MYTSSKRVDKGDIPDIGSILQGTGNANGEQNIKMSVPVISPLLSSITSSPSLVPLTHTNKSVLTLTNQCLGERYELHEELNSTG
jgi:hypothetical protein